MFVRGVVSSSIVQFYASVRSVAQRSKTLVNRKIYVRIRLIKRRVVCLKQIINLVIETDEKNVVLHIEMDKEKFNTLIMPLLATAVQHVNVVPKSSKDEKDDVHGTSAL